MDKYISIETLQRQADNLQFRVDTTPKWMGKFIYESMLNKVNKQISEIESSKTRLNLCRTHRQEANYSHFHEDNCHHCRLLKQLEETKVK